MQDPIYDTPPQEEPKKKVYGKDDELPVFKKKAGAPIYGSDDELPVFKKKDGGATASASAAIGGVSISPSESPLPSESKPEILNDPIKNSFDYLSTFIDKNVVGVTPEKKQSILTGNGDDMAAFAKEQKNRIKGTEGALTDELSRFYQESTNRLGDMSGGMRRNLMDKVKQNVGAVAKAEVERPISTDPVVVETNRLQKEAIKKEKKEFDENLFPAAAIIAYQNTTERTPKNIGKRVRELTADETVDRQKRYEAKGIELRPDEKAYNDIVGINAMEVAVAAKIKAVTDETPPEVRDEVLREAEHVENLRKGQFKEHKEFYQNQIAKVIGEEIYKEKNGFQIATGLYNITEDDIKRIGTKLGFSAEELAGIEDDDIPNESLVGRFYYNFIAKPATDLNNLSNRIWGAATGEDVDVITAENQKSSIAKAQEYSVPNAQLFQRPGFKIETDREAGNFLLETKDEKSKGFNNSFIPIATVAAEGFGQILNYGLGAKGVGGALNVAGLIKSADKAAAVGNFAYTFANTYEDHYQQAAQFTDDPAERNLFASLKSAATAASEQILPDYKIVNRALGSNALSPKAFIDFVAKTGIKNVSKDGLKGFLKSGIQSAGDVVKEVAEEELDLLAEVTLNSLIIPKANEGRNFIDEAITTGIVTGISAALPIGVGGIRAQRTLDKSKDDLLFHIGNNAGSFRSELQKMADEGAIDQNEANKKIQIVNTMAKAVELSKDVPLRLQRKYAGNLLQQSLLKQDIELAKDDEAKVELLNAELQGLIDERKQILTPPPVTVQPVVEPEVAGSKETLIAQATAAASTELQEMYRPGFLGDVDAGLKEAAQQLNASESEAKTARKVYGNTISDIAIKLYPDEKVESNLPSVEDLAAEEDDVRLKPFADEMVKIENEFNNRGYKLMDDYDNETLILDKKTGDIVDPEDVPEDLLPKVALYEKALQQLGDKTNAGAILQESRKAFIGEEAPFEEAQKQIESPTTIKDEEAKKTEETEVLAETIEAPGKPEIKLTFVSAKELVNSKDPIGNKETHSSIIEKFKGLKQLMDCLWD